MRILYIAYENTANVPYTLFRGINRHTQHHADMVLMRDNYLKYPTTGVKFAPRMTAQSFADLMAEADIIHLDDMPFLANGKIRYGFFGDGLELNLMDYFTENHRVFWHQNGSLWRCNHDVINDLALRHNINITVSTPDLLQFGHGAYWVPSPINLEQKRYSHAPPNSDTMRYMCSHAPSKRAIKGTELFISCVVTKKNIIVKLIERVSNDECLKMRTDCPLHFDQYPLGAYGVSSLEGIALGQLVMVGMRNVERYVPGHPFIDVQPTQKGILDALETALALMTQPEKRNERVKAGRAWLAKTHSDKVVVDLLVKLYEHGTCFNSGDVTYG